MAVSSLLEMMSVRRLSRRRCFRCWHPDEEEDEPVAEPGESGGMPMPDADDNAVAWLLGGNPNILGERVLEIKRRYFHPPGLFVFRPKGCGRNCIQHQLEECTCKQMLNTIHLLSFPSLADLNVEAGLDGKSQLSISA